MSNENQDKNLNWRTKLDSLEHLPGEDFNKEVSWNKLHERLQNKRKKVPIWYWAAAACLFFAMMIVWIVKNNTQPQLPNGKIVSEQSKKINNTVSINKDIASNEIKPVIKKERTERVNKTIQKENRVITPAIVSKPVVNDIATDELKNESLANSFKISNASFTTSLKPVEKKKLNVVHINELGGPVTDLPVVAHRIDKHLFQFEIAKGEVISNSSMATPSAELTISKIKTTSN